MIINRAALKAEARACMRQSRTSPYLTALVYAVVTFIISQLNGRLLFPSDLVHYVLDLEEGRMWLYIAPEYYTRLYTEPFAYLLAFLLQVAGRHAGRRHGHLLPARRKAGGKQRLEPGGRVLAFSPASSL